MRDTVLKDLGYTTYAAYQRSPLWKEIKAAVLLRDGSKCRICDSDEFLCCHHQSYGREVLLGEDLSQLVTLCRSCHCRHEFRKGRKVRNLRLVAESVSRALRKKLDEASKEH